MNNLFKKKSKRIIVNCQLLIVNLLAAVGLNAQTLKVEDCYQMAQKNYPLVRQYELIEKTQEFSIKNAQKGYLPQIGINGQTTYQSDVTQMPITSEMLQMLGAPSNVTIPILGKAQYRLYGEVTYSLTDLFTTKNQTDVVKANAEIETQKVEVDLYKLRERINSLFFGILLIDAQIEQTELVKKDIQSGIDKTEIAIANGVALKSAADNLKAELLKTKQRTTELHATRKAYAVMLSLFIGQTLDEHTILEKPLPQMSSNTINRPEMQLFELQNKAFELQNRTIINKNLPRVSLFVQGGFGKPALNILSDNFDPYYIAGVRLAWNLTGFYTFKNEKKIIANNQHATDIQKDIFLFNTNLALSQQNTEIAKMEELVTDDSEIILLRENVKNVTQTQLDNGTATTNDYLIAVNAEDQARQNRILHEIQLLMAQYNAQTTSGN
ncbi:MAG: TolC family protein [Prevotellaceae bacterium]|jgi:outer membrane protein TolC|nr:TolC family protein [Prevotellaceae bacterium]